MASISLQQLTGVVWSPGAGGIIGEIAWRQGFPDIEYRRHDTPSGLDHVCPLQECGLARHAIIQRTRIACAWSAAERVVVAEVHVYWTKAHEWARYLGTKAKRNSFVWRQMNDEPIRSQAINRRLAEKHERCFLKLNRNFSNPPGQILTRSHIEWNVRPPPVIDRQLESHKGFSEGVRRYLHLGAITDN